MKKLKKDFKKKIMIVQSHKHRKEICLQFFSNRIFIHEFKFQIDQLREKKRVKIDDIFSQDYYWETESKLINSFFQESFVQIFLEVEKKFF